MENKILITLSVLVLLAFPTSGQNTQQHLICKNVENVFADTHDTITAPQSRGIQGSPGKRGPAGSKGDQGPPGVRGRPGIPASVDYERISEMIDEKYVQGLQDIYSRLEEMQRNFTQLHSGIRCNQPSGVIYDEKCYFAPYISSSSNLNFEQAVQKCTNEGAAIAEIHSRSQQQALEKFFRSKIPSSNSNVNLWIGTSYDISENNLRFRSGKVVSIDQFYWYPGYPTSSATNDKILFRIKKDSSSSYKGLRNRPLSNHENGVVCEI